VRNRKSIAERATWLKFRDGFLRDKDLICHYCGKLLVSDAPERFGPPRHHLFCRKQGFPLELIATVDHVIPVSKGGEEYDEGNLVVCCHRCNNKKANKTCFEPKGKTP
jgi:5-methylcytosine-specific restriction endonuclease McrA